MTKLTRRLDGVPSDISHHFLNSTLRERIVEHVFVGEALRRLWQRGVRDVEVLRSEFDAYGYDIVMVRGDVTRHIQLKTGMTKKPADVSVARSLATRPCGCVIWIGVTPELEMKEFFWFGSEPGCRLEPIDDFPSPLRATRNKDAVRPPRLNHRLIPKKRFEHLANFDAVLERLFGQLPKG